jgi:hypothetical protein
LAFDAEYGKIHKNWNIHDHVTLGSTKGHILDNIIGVRSNDLLQSCSESPLLEWRWIPLQSLTCWSWYLLTIKAHEMLHWYQHIQISTML